MNSNRANAIEQFRLPTSLPSRRGESVTLSDHEESEAAGLAAAFRRGDGGRRDFRRGVPRFIGLVVPFHHRCPRDEHVYRKAGPHAVLRGHGHARVSLWLYLALLARKEGRRGLFSPPRRALCAEGEALGGWQRLPEPFHPRNTSASDAIQGVRAS